MDYSYKMGYRHLGVAFCVGHDTLFFKNIKAPCTVLSAKDRALGHNPMSALYLSNSYLVRQHDFIKTKYGEDAWEKRIV